MSDPERAAALEAIQLELFALEREYGDMVADFYQRRGEILKRRRLLLIASKQPVVPEGQKQCRKCDAVKDRDDFYFEKRYSDERRPYCKACDRTRVNNHNEVMRKGNVLSRGSQSEAA